MINCAGLHGDTVERACLGDSHFEIRPRAGQFVVFDKAAARHVGAIVLPVPNEITKGVVLTRTAFGNVLVGPTAEEQSDRERAVTTTEALRALVAEAVRLVPALADVPVTATYAGLRPGSEDKRYRLRHEPDRHWLTVGGIRSTGMTSSLGLAEHVTELLLGEATEVPVDDAPRGRPPVLSEHERSRLADARLRRDRLPLRAGDPARDRGRARRTGARPQPRRHPPPHALRARSVSGIQLRGKAGGAHRRPSRPPRPGRRVSADEAPIDIVVIGSGPAGLAAAAAARRAGAARVVLLERQGELGGVPRQCGHSPYGMREFHRVLGGRAYARRLVEEARAAGVELRTGQSVVELTPAPPAPSPGGPTLGVVSSEGRTTLSPRAVVVATGVRETTRAAALLPGQRPGGIMNTGALQDLVYLRGRVPFRRPVVLGSELVTMSALITCTTHGIRPVALIESAPRPILRAPLRWLPRTLGIPWHLGAELVDVEGTDRVRGVRVRLADGRERAFECDGLLLTGRFVPEASLLRGAGAAMDADTQGPCIDARGRTSLSGVYAVGNVLRGVETAGWAWAEGGRVARAVVDDLGAERARPPRSSMRPTTGAAASSWSPAAASRASCRSGSPSTTRRREGRVATTRAIARPSPSPTCSCV